MSSSAGDDAPAPAPSTAAPPPHEGDHLDDLPDPAGGAAGPSESERELAETVRSISRLEESN